MERALESTVVNKDSSHFEERTPLSIGVLVLNYNTWDLALRAMGAAIALEGGGAISEFVLFDDGSPTLPPQEIDTRIELIRSEVNRGFARSLVVAFARMRSDVVVLFDSDAYPLLPFASRVRERFEQEDRLGQLGFIAQDANGSQTESYFAQPTQWSLILGQAVYAMLPKRAPQASKLCVITGCMATRMKAYCDVGGIDEKFDFLDVDTDYSIRLRRHGWKVALEPSIRVSHVGGGTTQLQRNRVLHYYKSRWNLLSKHGLMWNAGLARALILTRLVLESMCLRMFGRYMFKSAEVLEDKALGREALINYCRANYR